MSYSIVFIKVYSSNPLKEKVRCGLTSKERHVCVAIMAF